MFSIKQDHVVELRNIIKNITKYPHILIFSGSHEDSKKEIEYIVKKYLTTGSKDIPYNCFFLHIHGTGRVDVLAINSEVDSEESLIEYCTNGENPLVYILQLFI